MSRRLPCFLDSSIREMLFTETGNPGTGQVWHVNFEMPFVSQVELLTLIFTVFCQHYDVYFCILMSLKLSYIFFF